MRGEPSSRREAGRYSGLALPLLRAGGSGRTRSCLEHGTYQSNEVRLFTDGKEICAMIGHDPVQGIAGYGKSVHEALRNLADELVKHGIWIEVTDPNHPFNWTEPPKITE